MKNEAIRRIQYVIDNPHETCLDLSHLYLTSLPPIISEATNITKLDLSFNKLTDIPDDFYKLENLRELLFFNNYFEHIPDVVFELDLRVLSFAISKIAILPTKITRLKNLEFLYLNGNCITHLPVASIVELSKYRLKHIDLRDNPIQNLPVSLFIQGLKGILDFYNTSSSPSEWRRELFNNTKQAIDNFIEKFLNEKDESKKDKSSKDAVSKKVTECSLIVTKFYGKKDIKLTRAFSELIVFLCLGYESGKIIDITLSADLRKQSYETVSKLKQRIKPILGDTKNYHFFFINQLDEIIND